MMARYIVTVTGSPRNRLLTEYMEESTSAYIHSVAEIKTATIEVDIYEEATDEMLKEIRLGAERYFVATLGLSHSVSSIAKDV